MNPYAAAALIVVVNVPVFYLIARLFWKSWHDFTEEFNPDPIQTSDDVWDTSGEIGNIWLFLLLCTALLITEYLVYVILLGGAPIPELEGLINGVLKILEWFGW